MIGARVSQTTDASQAKSSAVAAPKGDQDADGVPDTSDLDPVQPAPPARTKPKSAEILGTPRVSRDDCRRRGITHSRGQGACTQASGTRIRVVNGERKLTLEELDLRYTGAKTSQRATSRRDAVAPEGVFLDLRLTVTNKLDGLVDFRPEQVLLLAGQTTYKPDSLANKLSSRSLERRAYGLRPRTPVAGTVTFDVSKEDARRISDVGIIRVTQFSDQAAAPTGQTVGYIRMYRRARG